MGARIALELARRHPQRLVHLFASGASAPHRMRAGRLPITRVSDAELVDELRRWGGTPEEVLSNTELLELALPVLRADIEMLDGADGGIDPRIGCPLTVFAGTEDDDVPLLEAGEWAAYTTGTIGVVPVAGGHFFVTETAGRRAVLDVIADLLAPRA